MRVRHFRETDIDKINPRREFKADPSMDEWLVMASSGSSYTIATDDDHPVMVLGCNKLWEGVAQVWTIPSDEIRGNGLYVVKVTRSLLLGTALRDRIRRFHCIIHAGLTENVKWIGLLGFRHEGTMYRATPDKHDMLIYVKWFEQYLEEHHGRWTKKDSPRLQGDVEELFRVDARGAFASKEGDVFGSRQTCHAGS